jgi:protocatechuate 3,4-dioxygenase alpha subunit
VGPFFARDLLWKDGGVVLFPGRAERITLTGQVFDGNGAPIHDALFETWQADPTGAIPAGHDGARPYGYGRVTTDPDGRYAIETVLPGSYTGPGGERYAPQISVAIFARGLLKALHTRVFLVPLELVADDPLARAIGDPERLRTLIAARDARDPKLYRWDVRLRGAGEAVFLEL